MKRTAGFQAVLFMSALEVLPILRTRGQKRVRVERYGMIFADLYLRFFVLDFRSVFLLGDKSLHNLHYGTLIIIALLPVHLI
ncbi:hypothetical protein [uncultured Mailhella sp.]|uniref:hypothetical protein n=1 Tax=uncultured Mailhella sp. TaxID=1981031 RepID=UPI0026301E2D|nr:hypothetical protein [uncultured Mailhella sp.]